MYYDVTPAQPANGYTVAELFAGGGLMALGLKQAGFTHVWANDADKSAVRAYQYNLGDHIVLGDITEIDPDDIPDVDVIAGGPPCQDFSVAGKGAGDAGKNGKLVWTYLRIIERKQPKAFIFENVKGLISKRHRPTFDALLAEFSEIGYEVSWQLINAWDYGVAQKRERVFIVGIRKDLGFIYEFPAPDPADYRTKVLRDVIGDLPDPGVKLNDKQIAFLERNPVSVAKNRPVTMNEPPRTIPAVIHKGVPYGLFYPPNHQTYPLTQAQYEHSRDRQIGYNASLDKPARTLRAKAENILDVANHDRLPVSAFKEYKFDASNRGAKWGEPSVTLRANTVSGQMEDVRNHRPRELFYPSNHTGFGLRKDEEPFAHKIPPGGNWKDLPPEEQKAFMGGAYESGGGKTGYLRRESWEEPAATVNANPMGKATCQLSPQAPRRFTVRECLRIQSAPDWYVFPEDISLSAQYRIVGNGVACRVAWYLGRALAAQLKEDTK